MTTRSTSFIFAPSLTASATAWALVVTARHAVAGTVPDAPVMGVVGVIALIANFTVAALLYRFRNGDSNMASVWICTRNDAIGNVGHAASVLRPAFIARLLGARLRNGR